MQEKGAIVDYTDPHVPVFPKMREHHFELESVAVTPASVSTYDALLLATDHSQFDYAMLQQNAKIIIDTRGVYQDHFDNVIKA